MLRPETVKLLEEKTRKKIFDIGLGNDFLAMIPKADYKNNNRQVWLHQTKKYSTAKKTISRVKKATSGRGENVCNLYICLLYTSDAADDCWMV